MVLQVAARPGPSDVSEETPPEQRPHLLFTLGRFTLALPLAAVLSVERPGRVTPVPFAVSWLRGVTVIRGEVTSVVDLGRFAGESEAGLSPTARLLVVSGGGITSALLVDAVRGVVLLPEPAGALPPAPGPLSPWWRGAHVTGGEIVPVIDADRLMSSPAFAATQSSAQPPVIR